MSLTICFITNSNIITSRPTGTVVALGEIGHYFSQLALYIRLYELSQKNGITPQFNLTFIENIISQLEDLNVKLDSARSYLTFCKDAQFVKDPEIQIRNIFELESHDKMNLYNYVIETTNNVNDI